MALQPEPLRAGKKSLRLWAWASIGTPSKDGDAYTPDEQFPCDRLCVERGKLRPELQSARRCTLPIYRGPWEGGGELSCYMGRDPEWDLLDGGDVDPEEFPGYGQHWTDPRKPWESIADGCPGGWYRTEFIASVRKYRRRMNENGGHDPNPLVHADTDWIVLEALSYLEGCEAHARSEYMKILDAKRRPK